MCAQYAEAGYVEIDRFAPPEIQAAVDREVRELVQSAAVRRDLVVPSTGNTPRRYSNVNRDEILRAGRLIPAVYWSASVRSLLCAITGQYLTPVPYAPEEYLISRLHKRGDTHGWHWDDYTYAFVWVVRAPRPESGGALQFVPNVEWNRDDPRPAEIAAESDVIECFPATGSAYLLKADTALHRVAPLERDDERSIICYTFGNSYDLVRPVSHDTMELMYPEACAPSAAETVD